MGVMGIPQSWTTGGKVLEVWEVAKSGGDGVAGSKIEEGIRWWAPFRHLELWWRRSKSWALFRGER